MQPKVVSLTGDPIVAPGTPRPELIADLERVLEMAKAGEIEGIAYAVQHADGCTNFYRIGRLTRAVIGALSILQTSIVYDEIKEKGTP